MSHQAVKKTLSVAIISAIFPSFAQEKSLNKKPEIHISLPEIIVYGERNKELTSSQIIDRTAIKTKPIGNGNITDYMKSNVHVRFVNSDSNGVQQGRIMPESVSINGADASQTAYFVDNVNVNNELTISDIFADGAMQVLPNVSHTQGYFFSADALSTIDIQDSNISASLGGFMGGAVIAKTKRYSGKNRVKFDYSTTGDNWAAQNIGKYQSDIFKRVRPDDSGAAVLQPKYHKHRMNLMIEKSVTDDIGVVFSLNRHQSDIAQNRLTSVMPNTALSEEKHKYQSDNALLNVDWRINEQNRLELSGRYSNYLENKFSRDNLDNNVRDYHQGYGATTSWINESQHGTWTNTFAYDSFKDKRKSNSNNVESVTVLNEQTFDPLYNYEKGGYGDSSLKQKNLHFSTEYGFEPIVSGDIEHSISVGGIYQKTNYEFVRPNEVHATLKTYLPDGMEIMSNTINTPAGDAKTSYQNAVLYAENLISWREMELRAGLRAERDDYLKNTNIAPRLVVSYQPIDNHKLTLGANRYFGRSFASLKLTEEILKINQDNAGRFVDSKNLKTPHTDELSAAYEHDVGNIHTKLTYIHRNNKDRIILKKRDVADYYANGNNFSNHIYTIEIANKNMWKLGATYWQTRLGFDWLHSNRADVNRNIDPNEQIYLDGKLMTRAEMERKANGTTEDWQLRLSLDMNAPQNNVTWSNDVYIKGAIKGYAEIEDITNLGIQRYRTFDYGRHIQWDTALRWSQKFPRDNELYIQTNILNVLNKTRKTHSPISSTDNAYSSGREVWLKFGYTF